MAIQKIHKSSVSTQVFDQMKEQLLTGEWKPGEKLPSENELAGQFGVSRVTVRNALQRLAALELVETRFGEGTFVREPQAGAPFQQLIPAAYLNRESFEEIVVFRRILEGPVCRLACENAGQEDIRRLEEIYQGMEADKDQKEAFVRRDFQFHRELARITKNSIINQIYHIMGDVMLAALDRIVENRGNQAGLYYHGQILQAMKERDGVRAEESMNQHMEEMCRLYLGRKV